jgi:hypothetical protein
VRGSKPLAGLGILVEIIKHRMPKIDNEEESDYQRAEDELLRDRGDGDPTCKVYTIT